jgi:anaerobic selenocysteine-containing dehydrogenase
MDCPDTCSLEVTVTDGRVTAVGAAKTSAHPVMSDFICSKVASFDRRVYHPDRLLYPMRRTGAKGSRTFARITWDEAIATIADRFRQIIAQHTAEAILPYHYGGSNGYLTDGGMDDFFFARLGASRLARTLCAVPATEMALAVYGKMPGVAFEDYPAARCIIIWGGNPKASNIHLVPFLREAKRRGAFIAVVDPRANFSADEIDLHLPVYPGADLPLALGLLHEWQRTGKVASAFVERHGVDSTALLAAAADWPLERAAEVARLPAQDLRRLADAYAAATPAVIRIGWGLERNINGAAAIAAVLGIPALLGKFGVRGGGYTLSNSGGSKFDTQGLFGEVPWTTREINMTRLAAVLDGTGGDMADEHGDGTAGLTPQVRALFVYNSNPLVSAPDQAGITRGLAREDLFTVVFDQVMTDTAEFADVVLPATTFLESDEIRRGYGAYIVGGGRPVIAPCGQSRPNADVFAALGRAMGFTDAPFSWDAATLRKKTIAAISIAGRPVDAAPIEAGGFDRYDFPGLTPVQFQTVFPQTPDRKIHFAPPSLGPQPFAFQAITSSEYPLALITPATSKTVSTMFGEFNLRELRVMLHPADARARGISSGDTVRVFNARGEIICPADVSPRTREGVASMPKGAWRKSSRNGNVSTALCPAHTQRVGGAACYNDARVEITRLDAIA